MMVDWGNGDEFGMGWDDMGWHDVMSYVDEFGMGWDEVTYYEGEFGMGRDDMSEMMSWVIWMNLEWGEMSEVYVRCMNHIVGFYSRKVARKN